MCLDPVCRAAAARAILDSVHSTTERKGEQASEGREIRGWNWTEFRSGVVARPKKPMDRGYAGSMEFSSETCPALNFADVHLCAVMLSYSSSL